MLNELFSTNVSSSGDIDGPGVVVNNSVMVLNNSWQSTFGGNSTAPLNNIIGWNAGAGVYSEGSCPSQVRDDDVRGDSGGAFDSDAFGGSAIPADRRSADPILVGFSDGRNRGTDDYGLRAESPWIGAVQVGTDVDRDDSALDMVWFGGRFGDWEGR